MWILLKSTEQNTCFAHSVINNWMNENVMNRYDSSIIQFSRYFRKGKWADPRGGFQSLSVFAETTSCGRVVHREKPKVVYSSSSISEYKTNSSIGICIFDIDLIW